jgi:hypothetical protein
VTLQDHQLQGFADGIAGLGIEIGDRRFAQNFAYLVGFNRGSIERRKASPDSTADGFTFAIGQAVIDRTERLGMLGKFTSDPMWAGFEFQNFNGKWRVTVQRID